MKKRSHGFTLLELLTMVAIIAVLAGIAVPNFLEAQVRSKISSARTDMAAVQAALRAYEAQHGHFPLHTSETLAMLRGVPYVDMADPNYLLRTPGYGSKTETFYSPDPFLNPPSLANWTETVWPDSPMKDMRSLGEQLSVLTTPVAWLTRELPIDPFNKRLKGPAGEEWPPVGFVYFNLTQLNHDLITTATAEGGYLLLSFGPDESLTMLHPQSPDRVQYDPTNGTVSRGDLFITAW